MNIGEEGSSIPLEITARIASSSWENLDFFSLHSFAHDDYDSSKRRQDLIVHGIQPREEPVVNGRSNNTAVGERGRGSLAAGAATLLSLEDSAELT